LRRREALLCSVELLNLTGWDEKHLEVEVVIRS
jgi:hypothetical protein